jgi:hypothetical protein
MVTTGEKVLFYFNSFNLIKKDGLKFSLNLMRVLDVSAEVVLKNDSVRKLAELEGLQSLDLSGDSVTSTGQ